jgi:hypothetical protein
VTVAKKPAPKLHTWAISRIKGTPAVEIGRVEAPDAESAIKEAIRHFNITDLVQQKRPRGTTGPMTVPSRAHP